jgi:hypothetical protein
MTLRQLMNACDQCMQPNTTYACNMHGINAYTPTLRKPTPFQNWSSLWTGPPFIPLYKLTKTERLDVITTMSHTRRDICVHVLLWRCHFSHFGAFWKVAPEKRTITEHALKASSLTAKGDGDFLMHVVRSLLLVMQVLSVEFGSSLSGVWLMNSL